MKSNQYLYFIFTSCIEFKFGTQYLIPTYIINVGINIICLVVQQFRLENIDIKKTNSRNFKIEIPFSFFKVLLLISYSNGTCYNVKLKKRNQLNTYYNR